MEHQNPVHVFAKWTVKEGQLEKVLGLLKTLQAESTSEEGNLFYKIHQSNADANTLILFEGYANEAAVIVHRNSSHYQDFVSGKILPLLENREVFITTPLKGGRFA